MHSRPHWLSVRTIRLLPLAIGLALFAPGAAETIGWRTRFVQECSAADSTMEMKGEDWLHWRGPLETGFSPDKNLPDEWRPTKPGKDNLIWKQPFGCRGTPLIMNGRVYVFGADNEPLGVPTLKEKHLIGERIGCFDAKTGKNLWKDDAKFNVFHTDIVANRLGWSPMAGDPVNKRIYAHTTAGFLVCLDAESGKVIWQRQLTEEFGRVSGYGGRIGGGPIFDSGLVFVGIVNGSWGNQAIGANRFFAFDGQTGNVVWTSEVPGQLRGTYYSTPAVAVINGERLLISGGADGGLHAFQVRTGKRVWTYPCAAGAINPSPVVDGNLVYIAHGEENLDSGQVGRVVCVDASKVVNGKPALVWEFMKGIRFGLGSLALAYGKLYVPDDGAKLHCFDAKKGKWLGKYNYGTVARGAPVVADGKVYISETNSRFNIIKLKEDGSLKLNADGDPEDEEADKNIVTFKSKTGAKGPVESNCTPSISDGRIYLASRDELYCIGKEGKSEIGALPKPIKEAAADSDDAVAQILVYPAEITISSGATAEFELRAYNAKGQLLKIAKVDAKWNLPVPTPPKGATVPPPPLDAAIDAATGKITVNPKKPAQIGYVEAAVGMATARARVRVAPQIPYKQDFEMIPINAAPPGWVNTQGKYRVVELTDPDSTKSKVLSKVNTDPRPPLARALGYITVPSSTGYTIEADVKGIAVRGKLPDIGICANRYLLILDGRTDDMGQRQARLTTWEALPTPLPPGRIAAEENLAWKDNVWYRLKLTVEVGEKDAVIRGKIWERGQKEPEKWTMQMTDPRPNREGAPALYGYISNATATEPGSEAYYDNVVVTPNGK